MQPCPVFAEANRWLITPFAWGRTDCMLMLADWVVARTGCADPCAAIRGVYRDPVECEKLTGFLSDPVTVMARYAEAAGLRPTETPQRGDIALVQIADWLAAPLTCGALWLGETVLLRTEERGAWAVKARRVRLRAAWAVPAAGAD